LEIILQQAASLDSISFCEISSALSISGVVQKIIIALSNVNPLLNLTFFYIIKKYFGYYAK